MDWRNHLVLDYHLSVGQPVVKGSHVEVAFVLDKLATGLSPAEIAAVYPQLSVDDVQACLLFASALVHEQKFPALLRPGDIHEALKKKRADILRIVANHGATDVRVVKSSIFAASNDGELEIIVGVGPKHSAWFPAGLMGDLEDLLGCRVSVLTEGGLQSPQGAELLKAAARL